MWLLQGDYNITVAQNSPDMKYQVHFRGKKPQIQIQLKASLLLQNLASQLGLQIYLSSLQHNHKINRLILKFRIVLSHF